MRPYISKDVRTAFSVGKGLFDDDGGLRFVYFVKYPTFIHLFYPIFLGEQLYFWGRERNCNSDQMLRLDCFFEVIFMKGF
jgi:hypothetical protein